MGSPSPASTISSPQFDANALKKLLQNYDAACIIPCQGADGSLTSSFAPTPAYDSEEEDTNEQTKEHPGRPSRGARLRKSINRAASFSFSKKGKPAASPHRKKSSGEESQIQSPPVLSSPYSFTTTSDQNFSPEEISPIDSPTQILSMSNISSPDTRLPLPRRPEVMASRHSLLHPATAHRIQAQVSEAKARTHKIAEDEEKFIRERMRKAGTEHLFPKYRFLDFIGKGNYGRVFQALDYSQNPPRDVAIKLMNVDDVDYEAAAKHRDITLNDIRKEIEILMQLKDHGAENVNLIHEVLEVDGHLWLVCDYCPGGSIRTLLRASNNKCEEKYIKAIARELAIGLHSIHEANIIHRDLKAANVMIHEEGGLQIIDFGVAGIVESKLDKRGTIVGTPHWMPPEHHKNWNGGLKYGFEFDIWSYITTIYEIATGAPPHVRVPMNRLGTYLSSSPPRLSRDQYSSELCEFVEFVAQVEPADRPSILEILDHPYVRGTESSHPTSMLQDLVAKFMEWTFAGNQRGSLFVPTGAQAAADFSNGSTENMDFIFSTSRDLLADFDPNYDPFADPSLHNPTFEDLDASTYLGNLDDLSADPPDEYTSRPSKQSSNKSSFDDTDPTNERRVARGGHALGAIFEKDQQPYSYDNDGSHMSLDKPILSRAKSDLPLRNSNTDSSDLLRKEVDFNGSSSSQSDVELADADTIKQKRKAQGKRDTMGWQPDWGNLTVDPDEANTMPSPAPAMALARPSLTHAETVSEGLPMARDQRATMNLDDLMGGDDWMSGSAMANPMNRAAEDWMANSAMANNPMSRSISSASMHTTDDEYRGEDEGEEEDLTLRTSVLISDSEEESLLPGSDWSFDGMTSEEEPPTASFRSESISFPAGPAAAAGHPNVHADVGPPSAVAMQDDAPAEVVAGELKRLLMGSMAELAAFKMGFPTGEEADEEFVVGGGGGALEQPRFPVRRENST